MADAVGQRPRELVVWSEQWLGRQPRALLGVGRGGQVRAWGRLETAERQRREGAATTVARSGSTPPHPQRRAPAAVQEAGDDHCQRAQELRANAQSAARDQVHFLALMIIKLIFLCNLLDELENAHLISHMVPKIFCNATLIMKPLIVAICDNLYLLLGKQRIPFLTISAY